MPTTASERREAAGSSYRAGTDAPGVGLALGVGPGGGVGASTGSWPSGVGDDAIIPSRGATGVAGARVGLSTGRRGGAGTGGRAAGG
ncbi:hypothetical protein [uncultured Sphingomonas sp.]|uniref:hypothetical protein n=1 Tax=uncultured Sphingomonas sp. TaxID=158754 RepID=UPI0035C97E0A